MNDFFQELALNAKLVREKYNMSHPVNNLILEEIAEMIAHLRPDLAEEESNELFHKCVNVLPDDKSWTPEIVKVIANFNRNPELIH